MIEFFEQSQPVEVKTLTEDERIRLLGAYGLVDATLDMRPTQDYEDDDKWVCRSSD